MMNQKNCITSGFDALQFFVHDFQLVVLGWCFLMSSVFWKALLFVCDKFC